MVSTSFANIFFISNKCLPIILDIYVNNYILSSSLAAIYLDTNRKMSTNCWNNILFSIVVSMRFFLIFRCLARPDRHNCISLL